MSQILKVIHHATTSELILFYFFIRYQLTSFSADCWKTSQEVCIKTKIMGGGLSYTSRSENLVDDLVSSKIHKVFPGVKCYTAETATSHDYLRARSLCFNITDINNNGKLMDQTEFLDYFAPLIIFYDAFYTKVSSMDPSARLTSKSMKFRLEFLADFLTAILLLKCSSCGVGSASLDTVPQHVQELQLVADFAMRYQILGICISDC